MRSPEGKETKNCKFYYPPPPKGEVFWGKKCPKGEVFWGKKCKIGVFL